jgi:hypothetical protein
VISDQFPFATLDQLEQIKSLVKDTGRKYLVYYAERVHNEAAWHAGELIAPGTYRRGCPGTQSCATPVICAGQASLVF